MDEEIGRLSARHLDVLGLIADGLANKEIATALGISPNTVKSYVEDILLALGVPKSRGGSRRKSSTDLRRGVAPSYGELRR